MFKTSRLLFIFLFIQTSFAQERIDSRKTLEEVADSIYYSIVTAPKLKKLQKPLKIYTNLLREINDTTTGEFQKILSKKIAIEALVEETKMDYDKAISLIRRSIDLHKDSSFKETYLKAYQYKQLYRYWSFKSNYDSVIKYTKKTEEVFKDTVGQYHQLIAEAMFTRGNAMGNLGYQREKVKLLNEAIANNIAYQGEYNPTAAIQEHILATFYDHMGYYRKELECYKKVIKRWEAIPDHKDKSYLNIAYGSVCVWYLQHGDTKTAEQYLLKSERLLRDSNQDVSNWFNETFKGRTKLNGWYNRGRLASYKKDTVTALNYVNKILNFVNNFDKTKKENNPHNLPYFYEFVKNHQYRAMRSKADFMRSENPLESKKISEQILKLIDSEGKVVGSFALDDKLDIINYYIKYDSLSKANILLDDFIKEAKKRKDDYSLIHLYSTKGVVLLKENKFQELNGVYENLFRKMLRDTTQTLSIIDLNYEKINPYGSQSILDILIGVSRNYRKAYQKTKDKKSLEIAHSVIQLASEIFSKNFNHMRFNEMKYETTTKIHEQLLSIALLDESISTDKVLEEIEENASKTIWNKFLNSQQRKHIDIPDSILQKEDDLLAELYFYKKQLYLNKETDTNKISSYKEKLLSITNEIEETEKWYEKNYPKYFNQKVKSLDVEALKQKLNTNQKVIKYIFTEENVFAFIITKDDSELISIGNKKSVLKEVKPFIQMLNNPNEEGYAKKAQQMYQLLLSKTKLAKNQELVFIQDNILNYIPMEALVDENKKYLIENYKVSYAPSLLLWNGQIDAKKSKKSKLGIYAPTYKKYREKNPKRNDSTALFGASVEASKIANIFTAESFTGSEANKEKFLNNASNYNMLHLAMHSSFNNIDSEFSSLVFSPQEKDNKLFISELYNMSLNADLAVLSACNTGSGELKNGEGLVNISRAFTYAGVPSLVASLWAVPDVETSKIMISFYEELKQGKSKNEALQIAKLNYLNATEYDALKHPYYWAGFVVSGDTSPVNNSSNNFWWFGFAFTGVLIVIFRKKLIKLT
jgi:CHAT domain-containing protein